MNELVSIVIPAYNCEKYLDECLISIVSQSYKTLQIVVVDDGSTDSTPELCDSWSKRDSRITVIHCDNGGPPSARNVGFAECKGEWVWFIDSDDVIDRDSVEVLLSDALIYNPDLVMMDIRPFNNSGELSRSVVAHMPFPDQGIVTGDKFMRLLINSNVESFIWSMFFNASYLRCFDGKGRPFIDEFRLFEDMAFIFQLAMKQPSVYFEERKLYGYRQVTGSLIHKVNLRNASHGYNSIKFIESLNIPSRFRDSFNRRLLVTFLMLDALAGTSVDSLDLHLRIRKDVMRLWHLVGIRENTVTINFRCALVAIGIHSIVKAIHGMICNAKLRGKK